MYSPRITATKQEEIDEPSSRSNWISHPAYGILACFVLPGFGQDEVRLPIEPFMLPRSALLHFVFCIINGWLIRCQGWHVEMSQSLWTGSSKTPMHHLFRYDWRELLFATRYAEAFGRAKNVETAITALINRHQHGQRGGIREHDGGIPGDTWTNCKYRWQWSDRWFRATMKED